MIWYQTLVGPLFRFEEAPRRHMGVTTAEIMRNGNLIRMERARQRLLDALTDKWQTAEEIKQKAGSSATNIRRGLCSLHEDGQVERMQIPSNLGGRKYLWRKLNASR